MNPREKWELLKKMAEKYPKEIRYGQSLMCALQEVDLPLYEKINNSVADCFYNDHKCIAFAVEVMSCWYTEERSK